MEAIVISEVHGLDTSDAADATEHEAVAFIGFVGGVERAKLARRHLEGVRQRTHCSGVRTRKARRQVSENGMEQ